MGDAIPLSTARRRNRGDGADRLRLGSDGHKALFSRMLLDTFTPYDPRTIVWPKLDPPARSRLAGLPIWDIAVDTEEKASCRVKAFAETIADPLLKEAVELNAFEEARHKALLSSMVKAYDIRLAPARPADPPRDAEWAFMVTGYSECIDSFFAFGLFELAKRSGYFPRKLVDTFEPVIQEEGRHITFFVNWLAWHRRNLPWWRRPLFRVKELGVWILLLRERFAVARDLGGETFDNNFTVTGSRSFDAGVGTAELLDLCLAESERRLGGYDRRLLRPRLVPGLARLARRFMA